MASISYKDPTTGQFTPIVGHPGKSAYDSAVEGGYKGTKEEFYKLLATIGNVSNPNLLINGDLTNPINQRGQTEYSGVGYTIDRWNMNVNRGTLTVNNGYVTLTNTAESGAQYLRQWFDQNFVAGEIVTLAVELRGSGTGQLFLGNSTTGANIGGASNIVAASEWQTVVFTKTIADIQPKWFVLQITGKNSYVDIRRAKLELGDHFTGFYPTDPATELAKCQRYYTSSGVPQVSMLWNNEYKNSVFFPAAMRTNPTITPIVGNSNAGGIDIIVAGAKGFHWGVNRNAQNQKIVYLQSYIADAEIH